MKARKFKRVTFAPGLRVDGLSTARSVATIAVPDYTPFVLNAASRHEFGVDGEKAGVILLKSAVDGISAVSLFDTGAEGDFISAAFVAKHGLESRMTPSTQRVKYADGSVREARGELTLPLRILTHGQPFERMTRFIVAELQPRFDVVLGIPFCRAHQPRPDWDRMTILLPTTKRSGDVAWRPAYRASTRDTLPTDAAGMALCELSLATMEQLRAAGQIDPESLCVVNIKRERPPVDVSAALDANQAPRSSAEIAEQARCEALRAELFAEFASVFPDKLPNVTADSPAPAGITHKIQLKDGSVPYSRPLRRMSTQELDELKKQIQEYLDSGRLRPSESPWGTNVIFAKKKDGSLRFCVDYRGLNDATVRNSYPLPHTDDLFDRLQGARYYSKIDLRTGFYQILLAEADREKTAFRTRYGHFEWTVLPMGLTNAPATFQHMMNSTFRDLLDRCVLVFLDDIVVYSSTLEQHLIDVRAALTRLRANNLYAKKSKCDLFMHEIEFLGHHVGRDGLRVMADKVKSVQEWPTPRNASEVRSFLGLAGYYRRFIQGFSRIAVPLHDLTHTADGQKFEWLPLHQQAFTELKSALLGAPVLALPDPDRQYVVNTDASDFATGAVLQQDFGNGLQPIAYSSHKLSDAERRYPTHDREMLAIINMLGEWRTYLHGRQPFIVRIRTDHNSLQYFMTQQSMSARQSRWLDKLSDFDFKIEYVRGPSNVVADALSRRSDFAAPPPGSMAALTLSSLATQGKATLTRAELLSLPMFSAPSPDALLAASRFAAARRVTSPMTDSQRAAAIAEATTSHPPAADRPSPDKHGVIHMPSQQCTAFTRRGTACKRRTLRGHQCADHMRLLQRLAVSRSTIRGAGMGLFVAKGAKPIRKGERIAVYSGDWVQLLPDDDGSTGGEYFLQINRRLGVDAARTNSSLGRFANAPRGTADDSGRRRRPNAQLVIDARNKQGALRASAIIRPGQEILVSYGRGYWRGKPPADLTSLLASASDHHPDVFDDAGGLLGEMRQAALVDPAYQAVLTSGELGSLTQRDGLLFDGTRVVVPNDAGIRTRLLVEAHDAGTAGHSGIASTKDRLSTRVHWAGLASDVHDYVASCDSCQRNKVEQRRTAGLLRPPPVPEEPGYAINIDFVFGLPRTERGHTGYMSMTCRLSNWLEPGLCSDNITAEGAAQLLFDRWVRTFGLPARIVSDRDPRFTGRFWRELWRLLDTRLDMSSAGHPQTDGKAENRQRTANTMLRHYVDFEQTDWDMKLLHAAHAINHTKSVASGLTPFEVMFRRAPRLPLDIALADPAQRAEAVSTLPAVGNFLDRHRYIWTAARANMLKAQSDQKRHADKHRRDELFVVGDEVLLSVRDLQLAADKSDQPRAAKLTGRFIGPLKIIRVINPNAYELELPEQLRIHPVVNISKLRRYLRSPERFDTRPQPLSRPPPEASDAAGDGQYVVERILAERRNGRARQYLIKWLGDPTEECSWEKRANLKGAPDLLREFDAAQQLHADADSIALLSLCDAAEERQTAIRSESPGRLTPKGGIM